MLTTQTNGKSTNLHWQGKVSLFLLFVNVKITLERLLFILQSMVMIKRNPGVVLVMPQDYVWSDIKIQLLWTHLRLTARISLLFW